MQKERNRNYALIFIIILLTGTLSIFQGSGEPATTMNVEPKDIVDLSLTPDSSFSVNVTVSDITNLWGYTVRLGYDKDVLTATDYATYDPFTESFPSLMDDSGIDRLRPENQGVYINWTGPYANWDEDTPDGDATYVSATLTNMNQTSYLSSPRFLPTWVKIQKVKVIFVARQTTGDEKVMPLIWVGGKLYNGSVFTPSTTYSEHSSEWLTNPATGTAWTSAAISDLQAGVRSEQNGAWDGEVRVTQLYVEVYHNLGVLAITRTMPFGTAVGESGTFLIVRITFKVDALGLSALDLYQTLLSTPGAGVISHEDIDSYFTNIYVHDLVVKSVTPTKYRIPVAGETVSVNVNITNEGDFDETFFVTLTYNGTLIDNQTDIFLRIDESTSLTFNWDTTGVANGEYTLQAQVVPATDTSPDNNILNVKFRVGVIRDIAVDSIELNTLEAYVGESVLITVVAKNQGNFTESFSLTIKYDGNTIETKEVNNLPASSPSTQIFNWQTGNAQEGKYVISCEAVSAADDDLSNNRVESDQIKLGPGGLPASWMYAGIGIVAIIVVLIALYIINKRRKRKTQPQ